MRARCSTPTASPATTRRLKTAGLALDTVDVTAPHTNPEIWERVIARLRAGSMPPAGGRGRMPPPIIASPAALETEIDRAWIGQSESGPGERGPSSQSHAVQQRGARPVRARPAAFDVKSLLPGDETADGSFDNFADVLTISTAHLERYLSAARQVTRLATGLPPHEPAARDVRDSVARRAGRSPGRGSAVRISRRHRGSLPVSGGRRVPDQGPAATAVSGLHHGHGLAATARRSSRWQAAEAVHRRRQGARALRRPRATPATASRALPALPNGKRTCSSPATPASRSACR